MNLRRAAIGVMMAAGLATPAMASSHGEAPFIKEIPKVDGTDFYLFNSYEPGRAGYVTIIADYYPLQAPYGGPNYFQLDPEALYQIHIDNNGDACEDVTFSFRFQNKSRNASLLLGGSNVAVPLINVGPIGPGAADNAALNVLETFTMSVTWGNRYEGVTAPVTNTVGGSTTFRKPVDYIGTKSIPNYEAYAAAHVYTINLPGSKRTGRVFVGQRKDPFVVNLGEVFDLVNTNPLGAENGEPDLLDDANITSLIIEIPAEYLRSQQTKDPVIGGWTTASLRRTRVLDNTGSFDRPAFEVGSWVQVSRLAMPLVNELVIGLPDKNKFNGSEPRNDAQFGTYVTNPTLPALLGSLFGVTAPCLPRNDLVSVFLTGLPGLNKPSGTVKSAEMMRLNTNTDPAKGGIAVTPRGSQNRLGVIGGDRQGFPNGRRPGDDVVDIELRVVMGRLYPDAGQPGGCAPQGNLNFTDGAFVNDQMTNGTFPYLRTPLPGSPN